MRKSVKVFSSKPLLYSALMIIQIAAFIFAVVILGDKVAYFYEISAMFALFAAIYIVSADINPAYKIAWLVPILLFPAFGILSYIFFGEKKLSRKKMKKYARTTIGMCEVLKGREDVIESLSKKDLFFMGLAKYIENDSGFAVYPMNDAVYFPLGEDCYQRLLEELGRAKKFIYLEFFIIEPGIMLDSIAEILKEKVKEGIDVRLMYDDFGSLFRINSTYLARLRGYGIKVMCFNRFRPIIDSHMNNRDHRKIVVIDNEVAFTGGINIADEYINKKLMFGHWKDTGIMLKGEAVVSFTMMFMQLWCMNYGRENYLEYLPQGKPEVVSDSYVIPVSDSPVDNKNVYENIYLKIIYNSTKYIFINTPYLLIDNEMKVALLTASRSGVDVRITVPHIPDKKYVFVLTRSYYRDLIRGGVKMYEYTPGFMHAKSLVADDIYSIVGTVNMDYRSFYLHFECGAVMRDAKMAITLRDDYLEVVKVSEEITAEKIKVSTVKKVAESLLKLFAPLM